MSAAFFEEKIYREEICTACSKKSNRIVLVSNLINYVCINAKDIEANVNYVREKKYLKKSVG
jgi:hypothetical protein